MSPCPVCSREVDPLRSRAVAVRDGKVIAYCSKECLAVAEKGGTTSPIAPRPVASVPTTADSAPVIEIASTAPAKRDDTIGTWAIGDDTAIRKYGERSTAEHEALPPAKKRRTGLVLLLLVLFGVGGFGVYSYVLRGNVASTGP